MQLSRIFAVCCVSMPPHSSQATQPEGRYAPQFISEKGFYMRKITLPCLSLLCLAATQSWAQSEREPRYIQLGGFEFTPTLVVRFFVPTKQTDSRCAFYLWCAACGFVDCFERGVVHCHCTRFTK